MKKYLFLLLLAGCAGRHSAVIAPVADVPVALPAGVDSLVITPHRSLAEKARIAIGLPVASAPGLGRVGKKAIINIYYAPATIIGKKATAAVGDGAKTTVAQKHATQATDSATQVIATNAVAGRGNTTTQTASTKQATDWKAKLTGPLGWALAAVLIGGSLYLLWPIIIRRNLS